MMRTCEARVWAYGIERPCGQKVGVRTWYDVAGELHSACAIHVAERVHRFPEADPPEPEWLPEEMPAACDPIDLYKSWTDAGWTEAELREVHGA